MSFIYAEKVQLDLGEQSISAVNIMSDTMFTPIPGAPDKANWGAKTYTRMMRYGIVKSVIVNPKCCISFAGNDIKYAHDLLEYAFSTEMPQEDDLWSQALQICVSAPRDAVEFIICTVDDDDSVHITCVKDGDILYDCPQAWIGSRDVYEKLRQQHSPDKPKYEQNTSRSMFGNAIKAANDESVGGFIIEVRYDWESSSFVYSEWYETNFESSQLVAPGETIKVWGNAQEGGYAVHCYKSPESVVLDIEQGDFSIIYTNRSRYEEENNANEHTKHFMLPFLFRTSTGRAIDSI